jgi:hypothetical protein
MAVMPSAQGRNDDHVSSAYSPENVAFHGDQDEVLKIVAAGPRGAAALAALSVAVVLALWLAFFVFVVLPRGAIG